MKTNTTSQKEYIITLDEIKEKFNITDNVEIFHCQRSSGMLTLIVFNEKTNKD